MNCNYFSRKIYQRGTYCKYLKIFSNHFGSLCTTIAGNTIVRGASASIASNFLAFKDEPKHLLYVCMVVVWYYIGRMVPKKV